MGILSLAYTRGRELQRESGGKAAIKRSHVSSSIDLAPKCFGSPTRGGENGFL